MTKLALPHLRLFADQEPGATATVVSLENRIERLCSAYSAAVGRPLECRPGREPRRDEQPAWWAAISPADDLSPRHLQLRRHDSVTETYRGAADETVERAAADLATELAAVVAELQKTQRALREREAELAAGVPVKQQPQSQRHLVERLEAVLRGAIEALGCQAAGIYLLDEATTQLKLRAAFGLPSDRLLETARPLRGSQADLEALAGHAVALEDAALFPHWNLPEPTYGAAVCVPISTPTELLGTLWVFSAEKREFSDHEVNLVELSAGRVASDLEREMLVSESHDTVDMKRRWDDVVHRRKTREPHVAPMLEEYELSGWMSGLDEMPGEFYDWLVVDETPVVALGHVDDAHFAAALSVESLRSAWRAHVHHERDFGKLLEHVNLDLWSTATESVAAHLIGVRLLAGGKIEWSAAGTVCGLRLPGEARSATETAGGALAAANHWHGQPAPLGLDNETMTRTESGLLLPGDRLLLTNSPATARRVEQLHRADKLPVWCRGRGRDWLEAVVEQLLRGGDTPTPGALVLVRRK